GTVLPGVVKKAAFSLMPDFSSFVDKKLPFIDRLVCISLWKIPTFKCRKIREKACNQLTSQKWILVKTFLTFVGYF
ncbi:MAG: hypothetical protein KDC44_24505, partial [Phaeodactylibacter sp.]|nr:hypothetical protein [Phaeodactylibacter sp.]